MKKLWTLVSVVALSTMLPFAARSQSAVVDPVVGQAIRHDVSPPLREMAVQAPKRRGGRIEIPLLKPPARPIRPKVPKKQNPVYQREARPFPKAILTPGPLLSAPGLSEQDNNNVLGIGIVPPSVNGDIGLDGNGNKIYIQYINLVWGVFRANDGALINGPFAGNTFWTGFGGACETNNDGAPVVLYDDQAGRWLFSQFSVNQGIQCVAISTTSDPLGPYNRYAFAVTPGGANDYPKLGVWTDGTTGSNGQSAYTFTLRDFGGAGGPFSMSAGVMERDKMLVGDPTAQFIKFSNLCVAGDCIEGQLPQHLAGPPPPAGTCPTYWTAVDAAYDDSPHANDGYRNHTLCVDWANIANSTYTEGPLVVAGSNFDRFLGDGFSNCINPVNGGEALDCLAAFTMYRAQYRWDGNYARVVFNTTVDAGGDRAGIRWTQNVSATGDSNWALQQDGTYAPDDGLDRWMGSIAQNHVGNIALGYSVAGPSLFPSVRYTSRLAADAPGVMAGGEVSCHEGTGAQVASANRWGDYSAMSVDPTDDCTFWYTQEYYETTTSFDFKTRICSFRVPTCADFTPCPGPLTDQVRAGHDLWVTPDNGALVDFELPMDFFCIGSESVQVTEFPLRGKPLKISPEGILGQTDTIMERPSDAPFNQNIAETAVKIVALSLESMEPLTVVCNGQETTWDVVASLDDSEQTAGLITIHRDDPGQGGTYDADFPVAAQFTFINTETEEEIGPVSQVVDLLSAGNSWAPVAGPNAWIHCGPVLVDVNGDGIPGQTINVSMSSFFPGWCPSLGGSVLCPSVEDNKHRKIVSPIKNPPPPPPLPPPSQCPPPPPPCACPAGFVNVFSDTANTVGQELIFPKTPPPSPPLPGHFTGSGDACRAQLICCNDSCDPRAADLDLYLDQQMGIGGPFEPIASSTGPYCSEFLTTTCPMQELRWRVKVEDLPGDPVDFLLCVSEPEP